jgi:hypothetical protein
MILNIAIINYYYNAMQEQFFNESKVTDSLQTKKGTFLFMLQESTRKNYAKETELAMKKKEEKEKLLRK